MKSQYVAVLFISAFLLCGAAVYMSMTYEPNESTLEVLITDNEDGSYHITSSATEYYFAYTGELADLVFWNFGDGQWIFGFEIWKEFEPGTHTVTCRAMNIWDERYSAYTITVEPVEYDPWSGHEVPLILFGASIILMLCAIGGRKGWI